MHCDSLRDNRCPEIRQCRERNHGNVVLYFGVRATVPFCSPERGNKEDGPRCLGGREGGRSLVAIEHLPIFVIYYRSRLVNREVYMIRLLSRASVHALHGASFRKILLLPVEIVVRALLILFRLDVTMRSYKSFANIGQVVRGRYRDSRLLLFYLLARDRTIERAGRRNLRANENICGRTHILSERAAIILSTGICRTRIQERYTFRRTLTGAFLHLLPSPRSHFAGAGNYSYSLYSRTRRASNKNLAARCKTRESGEGGDAGRSASRVSRNATQRRVR